MPWWTIQGSASSIHQFNTMISTSVGEQLEANSQVSLTLGEAKTISNEISGKSDAFVSLVSDIQALTSIMRDHANKYRVLS